MTYGEAIEEFEAGIDNGEIDRPKDCRCKEDQGAGYTYHDEYGYCPACEYEIEKIQTAS